MARNHARKLLLGLLGGASSLLPFTDDFDRADGDVGNGWDYTAGVWTVSSNAVISTPNTTGTNRLSNPGFETAGAGGADVFANWTETTAGTSTVNDETVEIHPGGGAHAARLDVDSSSSNVSLFQSSAALTHKFYQLVVPAKSSTTGKKYTVVLGNTAADSSVGVSPGTDWANETFCGLVYGSNPTVTIARNYDGSPSSSLYVDNITLLQIVTADALMTRDFGTATPAVVRASFEQVSHHACGVVCNLDSTTAPLNYVLAFHNGPANITGAQHKLRLVKCVNGTFTSLIAVDVSYVADALIEIRRNGSAYQLWYNGTQRGTDQTIADAGIVSNTRHGLFSLEPRSKAKSFFVGSPLPGSFGFAGSSLTYDQPGAYSTIAAVYVREQRIDTTYTVTNIAVGGMNPWYTNFVLDDLLTTNPETIVFDSKNASNSTRDKNSFEAIIRRIWTANPGTHLIYMDFATYPDTTNAAVDAPTDALMSVDYLAMCSHYGVTVIDVRGYIYDRVKNHGEDLTLYMGDFVHLSAYGNQAVFELVQPYLLGGGATTTLPLPARQFDDGTYENERQYQWGTDYTSRTGTWTDTGTRVESSEVGATITFTATCAAIGIYRADQATTNFDTSIDGGAYANRYLRSGYEIPAGHGEHTITMKVTTGTLRIDEFWAI